MPILLLAALAANVCTLGVLGTPWAGRYITYFESFNPCEEAETDGSMKTILKVSRIPKNRPFTLQRMSGNVTITNNHGIDDDNWVRARLMSKSTNSDWMKNAYDFNFPRGACSVIRDHTPDFGRIVYGNVLNSHPCYIPPNSYTFEDEPVNWTTPKFPVMPFGTWIFKVSTGRDNTAIGCITATAHTVPISPAARMVH